MRIFFLLLCQLALLAADFDVVFVGTSPFCLLEALYQSQLGKKVLLLEEQARCGGAWQAIDVCGLSHVDLGCHQIGSDLSLKAFLEEYVGCKIVSMDDPKLPFDSSHSPNGYYFSQGCYELIERLLERVRASRIQLITECKVHAISVDKQRNIAELVTDSQIFTASKVVLTPMSDLKLSEGAKSSHKAKYHHLYLLIQDLSPPRFSYKYGPLEGVSRLMNLTLFSQLEGTGKQLIILQTHREESVDQAEKFLQRLKSSELVDKEASLLTAECYTYETGALMRRAIDEMGNQEIIEVLQTSAFQNLLNYLPRWKKVFQRSPETS